MESTRNEDAKTVEKETKRIGRCKSEVKVVKLFKLDLTRTSDKLKTPQMRIQQQFLQNLIKWNHQNNIKTKESSLNLIVTITTLYQHTNAQYNSNLNQKSTYFHQIPFNYVSWSSICSITVLKIHYFPGSKTILNDRTERRRITISVIKIKPKQKTAKQKRILSAYLYTSSIYIFCYINQPTRSVRLIRERTKGEREESKDLEN